MKQIQPRVLHYIDTTGPGGAETVFLQTADGLRSRGWEARMVVVGPGWVLDNVRALDLPVDVLETRRRMDVGFAFRLRRLIARHNISLIHAHLFSPAVYASMVGAWAGVPVVATFHGDSDAEPGGWGRRARYRLIDRNAVTVCVSNALETRLRDMELIRPAGIRMIHNGVDTTRFGNAAGAGVRQEHGIADDAVLVGAVGNVRQAKDYATLLRAAAVLANDARFVFAVAGECTEPLYGELLSLRDELGLADRVSFWGFRNDMPHVMAAFDIMVISSVSEGFSLAAIQAMSAGVPVVATRSGGPEDIITDGVDGLLVPTGKPVELANAIRRIAGDPDLRRDLVDSARTTVQSRFSLDAMLDGYDALYTELTTGDR